VNSAFRFTPVFLGKRRKGMSPVGQHQHHCRPGKGWKSKRNADQLWAGERRTQPLCLCRNSPGNSASFV